MVDVQEEEGESDIQTDVRRIRRGDTQVLLRERAERERGRSPELWVGGGQVGVVVTKQVTMR